MLCIISKRTILILRPTTQDRGITLTFHGLKGLYKGKQVITKDIRILETPKYRHTRYPVEKRPSIDDGVNQMNQFFLQYQKLNDQRLASLELKLGQICDALNERKKGKLPSQPQQNPKSGFQESTSTCNEPSHDQLNAVTTLRSGKIVDNNVGVPQSSGSESDSHLHTTPQKTSVVENESQHVDKTKSFADVNVSLPCHVPVAPFPRRLVQHKKMGNQYNEILEMFKRVNINISFLEAIKQIPAYANSWKMYAHRSESSMCISVHFLPSR